MPVALRSFAVAFLLPSALSLAAASIAEADLNARLNGAYHFTQSIQCINASTGFNPDPDFSLVPSGGFVFKNAVVDSGTVQYNGDGTGTTNSRSQLIRINQGPSGNLLVQKPISETVVICDLRYSVNPDGSVDQEATCNFSVVAGTSLGNTGTITGIKTRRQIVQGNTMLLHMPVDTPNVEHVTETTPATPTTSAQTTDFDRICIRSGVTSK